MGSETTTVGPGDTLALAVKGKVADPAKADTAAATTIRVYRPAAPGRPALRVEAILEPDAEIAWEITSRFKNGVHLDGAGRYWMRKPEGWFEMAVAQSPVPSIAGTMFAPPNVQRLKEDKDT